MTEKGALGQKEIRGRVERKEQMHSGRITSRQPNREREKLT